MFARSFSSDSLRQAIKDGQMWSDDADIPDPLNRRDFLKAPPEMILNLVAKRTQERRELGLPHSVKGEKLSGGFRRFCYLDPIADVILRSSATTIVLAAHQSRHPNVVHTRTEILPGGSWRAEPFGNAFRNREILHEQICADLRANGGGVRLELDISNFYPSVRFDQLVAVMHSCRLDTPDYRRTVDLLIRITNWPNMPKGLPVGPEISALLSTMYLAPVDRALHRENLKFIRWADDIWVYGHSGPRVIEAEQLIARQLAVLGLKLNDDKRSLTTFDAPDAGVSMSEELFENSNLDEDPFSQLLDAVNARQVKAVAKPLGLLRARGDARAISLLRDHRWITRQLPKPSSKYLTALSAQLKDLDREWIAERVLDTSDLNGGLERVRLAASLGKVGPLPQDGQKLFEAAVRLDRRDHAPTADAFAYAAGRSKESNKVRINRSLDYAMETADLNARRAFVAVAAADVNSNDTKLRIKELRVREPELAPTLAWIGA